MSQEATEIVRLGAGSFATVYVWQSRSNLAIKCVANPERCLELKEEFESHNKVYMAARDSSIFRVPAPVEYYTSFGDLLNELQMDRDSLSGVSSVYTMQRVWPIPPRIAASIKENYFPTSEKAYAKPFIARIYLGRPPDRNQQLRKSRFFNANNFPLDVKRCEELDLPVALLAQDMGKLLSRIHYHAELDGRDIEFVMGGDELNSFQKYAFFCFDFNQCKPHHGNVDNLVSSFFDNDPYYPRPGMPYWEDMRQSYLREAFLKSRDALKLAQSFVELIERAVTANTAKQPPEGRGNEMALLEEA